MNLQDFVKQYWPEVSILVAVFGGGYTWGKRHGAAGKQTVDTAVRVIKDEYENRVALLREQLAYNIDRAKDREEDLQQKITELTTQIATNAPKGALENKVKEVQSAATELSTANAAIGSGLSGLLTSSPPKWMTDFKRGFVSGLTSKSE